MMLLLALLTMQQCLATWTHQSNAITVNTSNSAAVWSRVSSAWPSLAFAPSGTFFNTSLYSNDADLFLFESTSLGNASEADKIAWTREHARCVGFSRTLSQGGTGGTLTSTVPMYSEAVPTYLPLSSCLWTIHASSAVRLHFVVAWLDLEPCCDLLTFYPFGEPARTFGADLLTTPTTFHTDAPNVTIRFISDASVQRSGFIVHYGASADGVTYTPPTWPPLTALRQSSSSFTSTYTSTTSQVAPTPLPTASWNPSERSCPATARVTPTTTLTTIYSNEFSPTYTVDTVCRWTIGEVPSGFTMWMRFVAINLEPSYDTVVVSDSQGFRVTHTGSPSVLPEPISVAAGSTATVVFTSDVSITYSGFRLELWLREDSPCADFSDETVTTDRPVTIRSSLLDPTYASGLNCTWTVDLVLSPTEPRTASLSLSFSEFATQAGRDYLVVSDAATNLALYNLSGSDVALFTMFPMNTTRLAFTFVTDAIVQQSGFVLTVATVNGNTSTASDAASCSQDGTFTVSQHAQRPTRLSSNPNDATYSLNSTCSWTVSSPSPALLIYYQLRSIAISPGVDSLSVVTDGGLVTSYTGTTTGGNIVAVDGASLTIIFQSGVVAGSGPRLGFILDVWAAPPGDPTATRGPTPAPPSPVPTAVPLPPTVPPFFARSSCLPNEQIFLGPDEATTLASNPASPSYSDNTRCSWSVDASSSSSATSLYFRFVSFSLETNFDQLTVTSSLTLSSLTFTGSDVAVGEQHSLPLPATFIFTSDGSQVFPGFVVEVSTSPFVATGPCSDGATATPANAAAAATLSLGVDPLPFWSNPDHTSYLPNAKCTWTFRAPSGAIVLNLTRLNLHPDDTFEVFLSTSPSTPAAFSSRSSAAYLPHLSFSTTELVLSFASDAANSFLGVAGSVLAVLPSAVSPTWSPTLTPQPVPSTFGVTGGTTTPSSSLSPGSSPTVGPRSTTTTPFSVTVSPPASTPTPNATPAVPPQAYGSCSPGPSAESILVAGGDDPLYIESNEVWTVSYQPFADCRWSVVTPESTLLMLVLVRAELEAGFDELHIVGDVAEQSSFEVDGTPVQPLPFTVYHPFGLANIHFTSDSSIEGPGFSLIATTSPDLANALVDLHSLSPPCTTSCPRGSVCTNGNVCAQHFGYDGLYETFVVTAPPAAAVQSFTSTMQLGSSPWIDPTRVRVYSIGGYPTLSIVRVDDARSTTAPVVKRETSLAACGDVSEVLARETGGSAADDVVAWWTVPRQLPSHWSPACAAAAAAARGCSLVACGNATVCARGACVPIANSTIAVAATYAAPLPDDETALAAEAAFLADYLGVAQQRVTVSVTDTSRMVATLVDAAGDPACRYLPLLMRRLQQQSLDNVSVSTSGVPYTLESPTPANLIPMTVCPAFFFLAQLSRVTVDGEPVDFEWVWPVLDNDDDVGDAGGDDAEPGAGEGSDDVEAVGAAEPLASGESSSSTLIIFAAVVGSVCMLVCLCFVAVVLRARRGTQWVEGSDADEEAVAVNTTEMRTQSSKKEEEEEEEIEKGSPTDEEADNAGGVVDEGRGRRWSEQVVVSRVRERSRSRRVVRGSTAVKTSTVSADREARKPATSVSPVANDSVEPAGGVVPTNDGQRRENRSARAAEGGRERRGASSGATRSSLLTSPKTMLLEDD